jgi:hypothetical protein
MFFNFLTSENLITKQWWIVHWCLYCMIGYKNDEYPTTLATSTIIILFSKNLEFSKSTQSPKNCERKYRIFKNNSFD